jgi:hypothetical protein
LLSHNALVHLLAKVRVVNLSEEILLLSKLAVFLEPQSKNGPVNNEKNKQKTSIVNSKPLAGSLGRNSCSGGKDSGNGTSDSGDNRRWLDSVQGCSLGNAEGCTTDMGMVLEKVGIQVKQRR